MHFQLSFSYMEEKVISKSLAETEQVAKEYIAEFFKPVKDRALIVALEGDLGSGKTAFAKLVLKNLGVEEVVTSPTFVIEKIYKIKHPDFTELVHIDAYRFVDARELNTIGWSELIKDPKKIVFVEWPEMIPTAFDGSEQRIKFTFINENERGMEIG